MAHVSLCQPDRCADNDSSGGKSLTTTTYDLQGFALANPKTAVATLTTAGFSQDTIGRCNQC